MKKSLRYLMAFAAVAVLLSFAAPDPGITGKWLYKDKDGSGYFIFGKDSYATIEMNGETIGGREYDYNGRKVCLKYITDTAASPRRVQFIIKDIASGIEIDRMHAVYQLINKNKLKIYMDTEGGRPKAFPKDGADVQILTRVY